LEKGGLKGELLEIETVVTGKISLAPLFQRGEILIFLFAGEGTLARRIIEGWELLSDRD
jgi:hypothetical protein